MIHQTKCRTVTTCSWGCSSAAGTSAIGKKIVPISKTKEQTHAFTDYRNTQRTNHVHWVPTFLVPGPLGLPTRHHLVLQTTINVRNSRWHISSIPQFHILPDFLTHL